jgi:hypothetical protein
MLSLIFYFKQKSLMLLQPVLLAVFYFVILTPVALFQRFFGVSRIKKTSTQHKSAWIETTPGTKDVHHLKRQF